MVSKILVIAPAWVGDAVMAHSLLRLLKYQHPDAVIDVVAPKSTLALTTYMKEVRQSFLINIKHKEFGFIKRLKLAWQLRQEKYDWAIVLPNTWKSALIPFLAGIPKRTGFRGEARYVLLNDLHILDKIKFPLMVERFLALGTEGKKILYQDFLPVFTVKSAVTVVEHAVSEKPMLALCPGAAFGPSKRWPAEYFAQLALNMLSRGMQVYIFGSPEDAEAAEKIMELTHNQCVNLVGKTNLIEAVQILAKAEKVVSNDSGLMHVACALHKNGVAIYGSSSPDFTPPLFSGMQIMSLNVECSPCFQRTCPLGHWKCMKDLTPNKVLKALI